MRWGIRKQNAAPSARCEEEENAEERRSRGKGTRGAFSFSPLSWLTAKLAAKEKLPGAAARPPPASTPQKNTTAAAMADPAFPSSCLPKRTIPSPAAVTTAGSSSSPPRCSIADTAVPRRLSVGNDNGADSVAAARRHGSRRHCSVGGDRELPPLGRLIPFSLASGGAGSPTRARAPSDTDVTAAGAAGAARATRRHRRRRMSSRRLSVSGGGGGGRRPSFSGSGRMLLQPPPRARRVVRSSPHRAAAAALGLESLAVVRRTRDPQRAFRDSMVEMIASASAGPPRAEELERLLACYLSLNADEHHDCIVKVFRQVWFEYASLLLLPRPEPEAGAGRRRRTPTARRCHVDRHQGPTQS